LTVAYDGACYPNVSVRMAWISKYTIDYIQRHREVGRAKDLSAPLYFSDMTRLPVMSILRKGVDKKEN
jgi:hypothetical protein